VIAGIKYYYSRFGINGVINAIKAKLTNSNIFITAKRKDIKFPFYLRCRTSDLPTYDQVFINKEYEFIVEESPRVIIDAGANIGLTSIYFANMYPECRIIAIEPEASNYIILKMNIAAYSNIIPLNAALWDKNEEVILIDPGLGKWGFITREGDSNETYLGNMCHKVKGMTIDKIMEDHGLEKIDILKIDIEGAEREVFSNSSSWIGKVDALIIELHERKKSGCNRSFYNGSNGFYDEWQQGENIFLSRQKRLTRRRS
jgi:FkbM family methyltransferase